MDYFCISLIAIGLVLFVSNICLCKEIKLLKEELKETGKYNTKLLSIVRKYERKRDSKGRFLKKQ